MKSLLHLAGIFLLSINSYAQQQFQYRLKINNLESLDYKVSLGEISNLFAPCKTTHAQDGTFIYTTTQERDQTQILEQIVQLGYTAVEFEVDLNSTDKPHSNTLEEKALKQDCSNATQVCSNSTFSGNSNGTGIQELNALNHGCLIDDERQSSWYYLYVGTSGTLGMTITPSNGQDDYDFAIWGPYTPVTLMLNCPPTAPPIRCNFTSYPDWFPGTAWSCGTLTNPTGMQVNNSLPLDSDACTDEPYSRHLDVVSGEIYIMIIDNWSTSSDPFDIAWNGTGVLDCTPIPLPVELVDFNVTEHSSYNSIEWKTLSEYQNDYFEIQCSTNSLNWKTIYKVDGAEHSNIPITYAFSDASFLPTINYYRIKQYDINGIIRTYDVKSADNRLEEDKIRSCTNLLGQTIDINSSGVKILIYNDGTRKVTTGL